MRITINRLKIFAVALIALPVLAMVLLNSVLAQDTGGATTDATATYAAKCKMCHGLKAEKNFDTTLTDDQMVEVVLKGKQAQRPPNMPAFETKGMNADQAKALVAYMRSLRQ